MSGLLPQMMYLKTVIPATTFDKGPLQFEIDEQLNTTWYKE